MLGPKIVDLLYQQRAHFRRALDEIFLIDHFQRSESARHGEIVSAERCRMNNAAVHA